MRDSNPGSRAHESAIQTIRPIRRLYYICIVYFIFIFYIYSFHLIHYR